MPRCHSSAHHGMSILMVVAAALFNELVHAGEIGDVLDWSRWTEVAGLPAPRYNLAVVQFSGAIYALGGEDDATYSDDVFRFDGMNWTQVEDLPYPCSEMAVAVHDGRIYLIGGNTTGSSVLSYDGAAWRLYRNGELLAFIEQKDVDAAKRLIAESVSATIRGSTEIY